MEVDRALCDYSLIQDAEKNGGDMEMFDRATREAGTPERLTEYFLYYYYWDEFWSATLAEMILKRGDPSLFDNEAVIRSGFHGAPDVLKVLLEDARVDPTARNNATIIEASKKGHMQLESKVRLLLSIYSDFDEASDLFVMLYNNCLSEPRKISKVYGSSHAYFRVVSMLLEDPRVASTLDGELYDKYVQPFLNAYNKFELMHRASILNEHRINPWLLRGWMPKYERKYEKYQD